MAIAFDNSTTSTSTGTSITITSFAVAATNPFIIVTIADWAAVASIVTGVTFNGVSMTNLANWTAKIENGNVPEGWFSTYYITGQSGTHNIVISSTGAGISASSGISG